jgi:hypothetical protein
MIMTARVLLGWVDPEALEAATEDDDAETTEEAEA